MKINNLDYDAKLLLSLYAEFYNKWIKELREHSGKELFSVGEYWSGDSEKLHHYITETRGTNIFI